MFGVAVAILLSRGPAEPRQSKTAAHEKRDASNPAGQIELVLHMLIRIERFGQLVSRLMGHLMLDLTQPMGQLVQSGECQLSLVHDAVGLVERRVLDAVAGHGGCEVRVLASHTRPSAARGSAGEGARFRCRHR